LAERRRARKTRRLFRGDGGCCARPAGGAACADSAPHPMATKLSVNGMPGIFNAPVCM
jgi:hypothetical protein